MSSVDVGTAFVRILPDTTGFRAALAAQVNAATGAGASGAVAANTAIAQSLGGVQKSSAKAAQGMLSASQESNLFRGSLIGLARVTPVAVFGLGVIGTAAIAAGLAIKSSIGAAADLEQSLNVFQAVSGATVVEMAAVSAQAKALGADLTLPATSANDAATAMTELAKAGLTVNDTLAASRGVMQLAAAANITAGQAATITATQLNAFGLAGSEATKITDLLAGASIAAQGEITDFATAFQQVSAVSHQVGLSVEDTTGLLTELAKAGLRGADGGTSLRTTLLRLVPTTKQAAEYVKALGININEQIPIGEQITSVIEQYRVALLKLTPIQQQETLTQIFGQDAIRAASIIFTQEPLALNALVAQVSEAGSGARLAEARMKGFAGSVEGLKSAAQTLGGTLGAVVLPALTSVVKSLSTVTTAATEAAGAIASVGGEGKPVANALGGADTFVPPALLLGAGLGIKKLLDMRKSAKFAASAAADAIRDDIALTQSANIAYAKLSTSAVAAADIQIGAATGVTTALARQTVIQQEIIANNALIAKSSAAASRTMASSFIAGTRSMLTANKALVAGLALSVAGGAVPGFGGNLLTNVGMGLTAGALTGNAGVAVAGALAGAFLTFVQSARAADAKDRAKVKAEWDKLPFPEQLSILNGISGGKLPGNIQGLQTRQDIARGGPEAWLEAFGLTLKPRPSAGPIGPKMQNAISEALPKTPPPDFFADIARGGSFAQTAKTFSLLFPKPKKFEPITLPSVPEIRVNRAIVAANNVALAQMEGDAKALGAALSTQLALQETSLLDLAKKATMPISLNFAGKGARAAWVKAHQADIEAYTKAVLEYNQSVAGANALVIARVETPSFDVSLAQATAAGTTTAVDNLAADITALEELEARIAKIPKGKKFDAARKQAALDRVEAQNKIKDDRRAIQAEREQAQAEHDQAVNAAAQKKADAIALVVATAKAGIDL